MKERCDLSQMGMTRIYCFIFIYPEGGIGQYHLLQRHFQIILINGYKSQKLVNVYCLHYYGMAWKAYRSHL